MQTRPETLLSIRKCHASVGLATALDLTRRAFAAGEIDPADLAEVFLALRSSSWSSFEDSGRLPHVADGSVVRAAA